MFYDLDQTFNRVGENDTFDEANRKLEAEELKRKGMTRQLLKKQQNHNHSSSNNNYGKEEDISRDRASSLPDMVF